MTRLSDEEARLLAAASPASFAHVVSNGRWIPFEHLIKLNDRILACTTGEIDRLAVTFPPRHGKSELISRYLPAWYLGTHPDHQVIMASYDKLLIQDHSSFARELLEVHGPKVFGVVPKATSSAAGRWHLQDHDGVLVASSLRGGITGRGAHLLIIDDPFKDELDASSALKRDRVWTWWQATSSTRLMPGKSIVIIVQTRWHEDDLVGRLLSQNRDEWELLNMPALSEGDGDPLERPEGDALCPELFDRPALERIRTTSGSYFFAALYQQRPAPAEGFMFKRRHFRYWREETETTGLVSITWLLLRHESRDEDRRIDKSVCPRFQTVDVAISERDTADWTVVATWLVTPDGDLLLLDVEFRHFEEQQTTQFLKDCNDAHGRPPMWVERFGAGRSPLAVLKRANYPVMEIPEEAGTKLDKVTRAFGAIAVFEAHKVWFPRVPPSREALEMGEQQLLGFNTAKNDDFVDTVSYAARLLPIIGRAPEAKPRAGGGTAPRKRF